MRTILYGGFHTKMDIDGELHPWRFVITDGKELVFQRQIRLPIGKTWLSFPRDPIWGDLLNNGDYLPKQIETLSQELPENTTIHLHERHNNRKLEITFRWNGLSVEFHNIEIINIDPSRISGEAGCEIGSLMSHLKLKKYYGSQMKAYLINRDLSITIYEGPPNGWMDPTSEWDATDINEDHDVYFQDDAMDDLNVIFIKLGKNPNIPLPAFVVGRNGEKVDDPKMTISELEALIS